MVGTRSGVCLTKAGMRSLALVLGAALLLNAPWQRARADGIDWTLTQPAFPALSPPQGGVALTDIDSNAVSNFIAAWQARAAQVRANQPAWNSPLITTTGMLEQRFRFDASEQHAGNGADTTVVDGGKGLDLIVSNSNEIQVAAPPYDIRDTPTGKGSFSGFGDWAFVRLKQQLAASPASGGDYFVTVWLQVQAPTGIAPLTNSAWTYLPTLAVGKGWGDFDIQGTVGGVLHVSNVGTLGDQIQTNIAFQYHHESILAGARGELDLLRGRSTRRAEPGLPDTRPGDRPLPSRQRYTVHDRSRISDRGCAELPC